MVIKSQWLSAVMMAGLAAGVAWAQEADQPRTWTDATGQRKVEATFLKYEEGRVHLKRKDSGDVFEVPSKDLSQEDQAYVRKLLTEKPRSSARRSTAKNTPSDEPKTEPAEKGNGSLTWSGTWNNRKYNTEGPLKCTVTPKDDKTWAASFEGTGLGKPFSYQATISTSKRGERTLLQGTSNVSGDSYQWTGYVEGGVFYGKYRSTSGNNGEFNLKESTN